LKEPDIRLLHQALHALRSRCDGAAANDGQGFAKPDVVLGHYLAELDLEAWEPWMQGAA
jgi:hypothetical protein